MSSTGRGPRLGGPDDVYVTPSWCVRRLLEAWQVPAHSLLLEPAAGDGAIIRAVKGHPAGRACPWVAVESRSHAAPALQATGAETHIADFLQWETLGSTQARVRAVVTNPPFAHAEAFLRRSRELCPTAQLVFLVRLGFLAGGKRRALWRDLGQPDVYALPDRPSFTPDGATDSADYCWIVLPELRRDRGEFRVLNTTSAEERGRKPRRRKAPALEREYTR